MKKTTTILCCILLSCTLTASAQSDTKGIKRKGKDENRLALVIGNADYRSSPLKNPVNDALDMAKTLESLEFDVAYRKNASRREIEESIYQFGERLRKENGIGLFYFSGHGVQVKGRNYLIPVDADIRSESDVRFEGVDAGRVLGKMEDAGNRLNIVILDACRDNPYAKSFRSDTKGLARMDAPTGTFLAYATSPESVAFDNPEERNGIYTKYLLKHIKTPGLGIEKVFKNTRIDVVQASGGNQTPWESSSLMGDFYFAASGSTTVITPQPVKKESTLKVTSDVSGSSVWINGTKYSGYAPREFTIKSAGKYTVKVTANGYKDYEKTEYIEIGKDVVVQAYLEKDAPVVSVKPSSKLGAGNVQTKIQLRNYPLAVSIYEGEDVFKLNQDLRPLKYVKNEYEDQGSFIVDHATGLMWQKVGSPNWVPFSNTQAYIDNLNRKQFAGYSDWRLPTIDELTSLLEPKKQINNFYIDPIFDSKHKWCWSADTVKDLPGRAWGVNFNLGGVLTVTINHFYVRAVRSRQ